MENKFIRSLSEYKEKCDKYLVGSEFSDFLDRFGLTSVMKDYYRTFLKHCGGGKRIRAYLTYLGFCLNGDMSKGDAVLLPSLSYELFQTGILAHDDIIDNSETRRFMPSMHMELGGDHMGISKSICVGDFGIVAANEAIAKSEFDEKIKLKAISHQNRIFISTIAGELCDIEFSGKNGVDENDILQMNLLKTAQYTVSGPLALGSILSGMPDEETKKLSTFGDFAGIAFQIKDDILGMFGDEKKLGKSVVADMCEGKQTVISAHFFRTAASKEKEEFLSIYGNRQSTEVQLKTARKLLSDNGSLEYAQKKCENAVKEAEKKLEEINGLPEEKNKLYGLLEYLTQRNN